MKKWMRETEFLHALLDGSGVCVGKVNTRFGVERKFVGVDRQGMIAVFKTMREAKTSIEQRAEVLP